MSERFTQTCKQMLEMLNLGEIDVNTDPGLIKTPKRMAKSLEFLTSGYQNMDNLIDDVKQALFDINHQGDFVLVKDITVHSLCEHHVLPFFGKASILYIPDKKVLGISKFARIVDQFSRRLQTQERLGRQICDFITEHTGAKGVMVTIECSHMCMNMRGATKPGSLTRTEACSGEFKDDIMLYKKAMMFTCKSN